MFVSWLLFTETFTHRPQAQANDIISQHLELLLLTNNKNFSDFIKNENLQKTNFFIYWCMEKETIFIQHMEFIPYVLTASFRLAALQNSVDVAFVS